MANSELVLNWLTNLLVQLRSKAETEQQKIAEARDRLVQLQEQIRATELVIPLARHDGIQVLPDAYDALVARLKENKGKMTQIDALMAIANASNGSFKVQNAKRLMLEAGLIANPKNADSIIYTLIARSGEFEKVKPGEYKLVSKSTWTIGETKPEDTLF